ncbi:SGNH/GDSL hydrolase family protein [Chitinophaga sedimenti]|uniref:SGNH/GDSL hydrolase family protein n=1 Tax=Chitinophaga sedimenti TaxID=2033606 RepID=UPI0020065524|nr:SGNH/GDSL hydrolase family protein [Chitinophaga sedimenti]MCK7553971.1 SGNH/GDSL hydrolase family protein [Chitinophaga sedimenti]
MGSNALFLYSRTCVTHFTVNILLSSPYEKAALTITSPRHLASSRPIHPPSTKRILFLGNSITYAGGYINYIETYWLQHHASQQMEFINMGLPSETVSGLSELNHADGKFPRPDLHERLSRIIRLVKPDLVFACYGMNDGIYLPFDTARFNRFKEGIQWLHQQYVSQGIPIIHVTPPVYDEERGGAKGYATVLDRYTDWLLSLRDSSGKLPTCIIR